MANELQMAFNQFKRIEEKLAKLDSKYLLGNEKRKDYLKKRIKLKKEFKLRESDLMSL